MVAFSVPDAAATKVAYAVKRQDGCPFERRRIKRGGCMGGVMFHHDEPAVRELRSNLQVQRRSGTIAKGTREGDAFHGLGVHLREIETGGKRLFGESASGAPARNFLLFHR